MGISHRVEIRLQQTFFIKMRDLHPRKIPEKIFFKITLILRLFDNDNLELKF